MLVEWCPECGTWVDDLEVEFSEGRVRHRADICRDQDPKAVMGAAVEYIQVPGLPARVRPEED